MNSYLQDVLSQPEQLIRALEWYEGNGIREKIEAMGNTNRRRLIFSGMGSSHFCSIPAGIYLKNHGWDNQVISTGELLYYQNALLDENALLVLISQSGESAETVHLIRRLNPEVMVIAITNQEESTLGRRGNVVLPLHVEEEAAVTTRTYLASVMLTLLLAFSLVGKEKEGIRGLYEAVDVLKDYLAGYRLEMNGLTSFAHGCGTMALMGRGYSMGSVKAGTLFMQEIVRSPAMEFDSAEFKHGPLEMVEAGVHAVIFAPEGETLSLSLSMAENIALKGGQVLVITGEGNAFGEGKAAAGITVAAVHAPAAMPEVFAPIWQIAPVQLLADILAEKRKIPTGCFRWGKKVMDSEN